MKKILGLLVMGVLVGCGGGDTGGDQPALEVVPVKAVKVTASSVDEGRSFSGTVEPVERVRLSTRLSGWVDAVFVEEGQLVSQGALLLKLRTNDLQAKLAQAEAGIAAATAQYENARKNLSRIESLFADKAATRKELDDMRTAFTAAESQKQAADQQKAEVEEMLRYAQLRAPFSGVVTRKMIEPGDLANPGMPLMEVENADRVKIVAKVPETVVGSIAKGMAVSVQIGPDGALRRTGIVDQVVPSADPMSRQFDIKVLLENPDKAIKSGVFARISLTKGTDETLLVPRSAIVKRGQLEGLYIIDAENKVRLRWIRTGRVYSNGVEVLSGVAPGDLVVSTLDRRLVDGQPVEVVHENTSRNIDRKAEVQG